MSIELNFFIPMWLIYGYPVLGLLVTAGLVIWARYTLANRPTWKEHIKSIPLSSVLVMAIWPVALFVTVKDEVRAKRKIKQRREEREARDAEGYQYV